MSNLKILEFNTRKNRYIFDGVSGSIFAVDDIMMDCIHLMSENLSNNEILENLQGKFDNKENIIAALNFVQKITKEGALYVDSQAEQRKWKRGINFNTNTIEQVLKLGYTHQIILNVTEDCNMRCKYCFWSEEYKYSRNRTNKLMSSDVAIRALDNYFGLMKEIQRFNPGKKCAITFYGGEALLNFNVIKECIEYAKNNCPIGIVFNITTNGVLLKDDIADYLIKNEVNITISLDGTKENHDRNRIDAGGKGTFDIIMNNVTKIVHKYPEYKKINFACVYDYNTKMKDNDNFFEQSDLPPVVYVSQVSNHNTDYFSKYNQEEIVDFLKNYSEMVQKYIDHKINGKPISSYLEILLDLQFSNILLRIRGKDKKFPFMPYTGACVPGMKISVSTNGRYDICEKINDSMPIGNIETGLDIKAITEIIKKYNRIVTKNCINCPINRQCNLCYALSCTDGTFIQSDKCESIIESFKLNLIIIYTILEENPHAFDLFKIREEWVVNS